jgi:hypothetical protein
MNRAECDRCGMRREFVSEPRLRRACENCGHLADSEASSAQFPIHVAGVVETDTPIPVSIAFSPSSEAAPATETVPQAAADAAPITEREPRRAMTGSMLASEPPPPMRFATEPPPTEPSPGADAPAPAARTARWAAIIAPSPPTAAATGVAAPVVVPPLQLPPPGSTPFEAAPSSAPSSRLLLGEPWTVHGPPPSRPASELLALDEFEPPPAPREMASESTSKLDPERPSPSPLPVSLPLGDGARSRPGSAPSSRSGIFDPALASDAPTFLPTVPPLLATPKTRRFGSAALKAAALAAAFLLGLAVPRRPRDEAKPVAATVAKAAPVPVITAAPSVVAPIVAPAVGSESRAAEPASAKSASPKPAPAAFDTRVAGILVNKASARARSCKKGNPVSGAAVVAVTFAPTGYATSANVSGLDSPKPATVNCIVATFRGLRVPAFAGAPVTLTKTVAFD